VIAVDVIQFERDWLSKPFCVSAVSTSAGQDSFRQQSVFQLAGTYLQFVTQIFPQRLFRANRLPFIPELPGEVGSIQVEVGDGPSQHVIVSTERSDAEFP
jgi:hypothetical protein